MTHASGPEDVEGSEELLHQIANLEAALTAITSGGVDAVVVGAPGHEQVYTLHSADAAYRVLVEGMGEGAATVSVSGTVLYANHQLITILGRPREDIVGHALNDLMVPEAAPQILEMLDVASGETLKRELDLRGASAPVPVLVAATGLEVEDSQLRCLVITDLTARKAAEAAESARALAAQQLADRQRVAFEVNDTIVQGLVSAEVALDMEELGVARAILSRTSARAREWIGELIGVHALTPGSAVRSRAASVDSDRVLSAPRPAGTAPRSARPQRPGSR